MFLVLIGEDKVSWQPHYVDVCSNNINEEKFAVCVTWLRCCYDWNRSNLSYREEITLSRICCFSEKKIKRLYTNNILISCWKIKILHFENDLESHLIPEFKWQNFLKKQAIGRFLQVTWSNENNPNLHTHKFPKFSQSLNENEKLSHHK